MEYYSYILCFGIFLDVFLLIMGLVSLFLFGSYFLSCDLILPFIVFGIFSLISLVLGIIALILRIKKNKNRVYLKTLSWLFEAIALFGLTVFKLVDFSQIMLELLPMLIFDLAFAPEWNKKNDEKNQAINNEKNQEINNEQYQASLLVQYLRQFPDLYQEIFSGQNLEQPPEQPTEETKEDHFDAPLLAFNDNLEPIVQTSEKVNE